MSSRGTSDYGTGPPPTNGRQRSRSGTGQPHQTHRDLLESDRLPLLTDEEAIYSSDSMEYTIDFPKPNNQHNIGMMGEEAAIAENLLSDGWRKNHEIGVKIASKFNFLAPNSSKMRLQKIVDFH